jgi:two-component system sensor histidine kinase VicK
VRCDPERVRQVLVNLLDNAIKYSPGGGAITVSLAPRGDDVRVSVTDEGLGVPPGERERIFEKFYRLDPGLTRGVGGTGLGLYISRQYIDQMQGRLWMEPAPGRGSTFHVELPVAA